MEVHGIINRYELFTNSKEENSCYVPENIKAMEQ
jgi:hypothetical protein